MLHTTIPFLSVFLSGSALSVAEKLCLIPLLIISSKDDSYGFFFHVEDVIFFYCVHSSFPCHPIPFFKNLK